MGTAKGICFRLPSSQNSRLVLQRLQQICGAHFLSWSLLGMQNSAYMHILFCCSGLHGEQEECICHRHNKSFQGD